MICPALRISATLCFVVLYDLLMKASFSCQFYMAHAVLTLMTQIRNYFVGDITLSIVVS